VGGEKKVEIKEEIVIKTIRIPYEINKEITTMAKEDDRSINSMMLKMFSEIIEKRKAASI